MGNSYQALEDGTAYTYLVDAHWSAELKKTYTFVNLADPELDIPWPIPLSECELSEADRSHPLLADVEPMAPRRTLVTGANGQLGRAVRAAAEARGLTGFDYCDVDEFDFSDPAQYGRYDWPLYGAVINCGAYTAVDGAETPEGRVAAWRANATGPALLSKVCAEHGITLVHVSSDYVFDGAREAHDEGEPLSPLSVYGASKAAGDLAVSTCPATTSCAARGWSATAATSCGPCAPSPTASPTGDRSTTSTSSTTRSAASPSPTRWPGASSTCSATARARRCRSSRRLGAYDLTGSGRAASWAEVAREVFALRNGNGGAVRPRVHGPTTTPGAAGPARPRGPPRSALELSRIRATGFRAARLGGGARGVRIGGLSRGDSR